MQNKFAIKINKIKKSFSEKVVLDDVSFSLYFKEKVGFVGANGSGKSTLSKIICGMEKQDGGEIEIFKNFKISYLPQEISGQSSVLEYLNFSEKNKSKVLKELAVLGFSEEILLRKISSLSGGEKTKIFLTKVSIESSEIIILDEPTNNLDGEGLEFLEKVIKNSNSAFLIISHDRNFLDKTVSKIIELDESFSSIKIYDGNYSDYKVEKEKLEQRQNMLYVENQRQKGKIEKKIKDAIEKTTNKNNTYKVKNKKHGVHFKSERAQQQASGAKGNAERELRNFEEKKGVIQKRPLKIDFSEMEKSGKKVLEIKDLKLPYGHKEKISLEIFSGCRVLIAGKNGAGKTTFLKEILKENKSIFWGANVEIGYLPQDFLQEKNLDKKFIDYFLEKTEKKQSDSRKILARFGFLENEVRSKISELSAGMRGRGKIALMIANNPNVLVLDEPTNNLDLEVLEKLEKALGEYKGTIIFVSHDKYFIEKIKPDKVLNLD